jgi:hypothetical protein
MLFILLFPNWYLNFRALFLFVIVDFVLTALPDVLSFVFPLGGVFRNFLDTSELSPSGNSDVIVLIVVVVLPAFRRRFCVTGPSYMAFVEQHPVDGSLRS